MTPTDLEDLELTLFLEAVFQRYGYDFREYARSSLKRRVALCQRDEQLATISSLQERVLHEPAAMERFLRTMSVNVTAMFRDPHFYAAFRRRAAPALRGLPNFRVWHAGCATGEEVYSLAILLKEEGLYDRALIYATDMNNEALETARHGIYPVKDLKQYTANYQQAGGLGEFSAYYTVRRDQAQFSPELARNVVWAPHNLATDASFNEFQVVWCRNVMIYFNPSLAARIHHLLYDSLAVAGVLGLGSKETIHFTPHEAQYEALDRREKLYRKIQ